MQLKDCQIFKKMEVILVEETPLIKLGKKFS